MPKKIIKPGITRIELARMYGYDVRVIGDWLKDIGVTHQKSLSPIEIIRFIKHVGIPSFDVDIRIPDFQLVKYKQGEFAFAERS